jgi:hypothetical protein
MRPVEGILLAAAGCPVSPASRAATCQPGAVGRVAQARLVGQPDVAAGGWRCLVDGLSCALPSSRPPPVAAARPPFSAAKA